MGERDLGGAIRRWARTTLAFLRGDALLAVVVSVALFGCAAVGPGDRNDTSASRTGATGTQTEASSSVGVTETTGVGATSETTRSDDSTDDAWDDPRMSSDAASSFERSAHRILLMAADPANRVAPVSGASSSYSNLDSLPDGQPSDIPHITADVGEPDGQLLLSLTYCRSDSCASYADWQRLDVNFQREDWATRRTGAVPLEEMADLLSDPTYHLVSAEAYTLEGKGEYGLGKYDGDQVPPDELAGIFERSLDGLGA